MIKPRQYLLLMALGIAMSVSASAQIVLKSYVIGTGGGAATDGTNIMAGTIGQSIIGPVTNSSNWAGQGFWYTLPVLGTTGVDYVPGAVAAGVALYQNVPNPFSTTTQVRFYLPKSMNISFKLFDEVGHEVRTLAEGVHEAGITTLTVSADQLESGYYTARLIANGTAKTIGMVVVQ